jgi:hypothetical protein
MGNHYHLFIEGSGIPATDCQPQTGSAANIASGERKEESKRTPLHFLDSSKISSPTVS